MAFRWISDPFSFFRSLVFIHIFPSYWQWRSEMRISSYLFAPLNCGTFFLSFEWNEDTHECPSVIFTDLMLTKIDNMKKKNGFLVCFAIRKRSSMKFVSGESLKIENSKILRSLLKIHSQSQQCATCLSLRKLDFLFLLCYAHISTQNECVALW